MTDNDEAERLNELMRRVRTDAAAASPVEEMWPAIRSRIEAAKVEQLAPGDSPPRRRRRWLVPSMAVAAAAVFLIALTLVNRRRSGSAGVCDPAVQGCAPEADSSSGFTFVADSTRDYEEESRALLNDLELRRSMLRPEAAVAIDRDLRVVDSAIAEVQNALKHDPNNPALRRLLASSYREKLSVLHRVGNAG